MSENVRSACEEARRLWIVEGLSIFQPSNQARFLLVCKSLRKYCAGDANAATVVQEHDIYSLIGDVCKSVYMRKLFLDEDQLGVIRDNNDFKEIILVLCQLAANFINCGDTQRRYVWSSPESIEVFKHMLAVSTYLKYPKALVAVMACIYNSLCQNSLENIEQLFQSRDLVCQMLLAVVDCEVILLNGSTATTSGSPEDHTQLLEWYYLLIQLFIKKQSLNRFYHVLTPTAGSIGILHEQMILLQIVVEIVNETSCCDIIISSFRVENAEQCDLALFILTLADNITFLNILEVNISNGIMSSDLIVPKLLLESFPIHLDIISSLLVLLPVEVSNPIKINLLLKTRLLDVCLYVTNNLPKSHSRDAAAVDQSSYDILKLCLQVISNLVYRCKVGQDMIRDAGGLPIVMSRCTTDFKNPLAREWALLCLRNCCEGSSENQAYIDNINIVQDVVQDEELQAKGITVSIDNANGKIKFNKKDT